MVPRWSARQIMCFIPHRRRLTIILCNKPMYKLKQTLIDTLPQRQINAACIQTVLKGNLEWFRLLFANVTTFWSYHEAQHLHPYYPWRCPIKSLVGMEHQAHQDLYFILLSIRHNQPAITNYFLPLYSTVVDAFKHINPEFEVYPHNSLPVPFVNQLE